jgi:glycosyltransferase involved in cell wall biosynthesis
VNAAESAGFAPEHELLRSNGARLKRFKRLHRLGRPCLLFVGPYTPNGGLDVAVEAAHRLRADFADVRLTAVPAGPIDATFLDQCEMQALDLGHRGIIQWSVDADEVPFWYATASVVCAPWTDPVAVPSPAPYAAAAGRPFIGADIEPFRRAAAERPDEISLVPPRDAAALAAACASVFRREIEAEERRPAPSRIPAEG